MEQLAKKRKFLSLEDKARIIAQAEAGKRKALIAEEFGIGASSLSTILKNKDAIGKALASGTSAKHKKVTQPVHEALDKAVYTWFVETRAQKIALSGDIVRQKALDFACMLGIDDFKASVGWLNRFKSRHSIIGKVLCGEAASADKDGTAAVKCAYRKRLIQRLILNTRLGRETKIDLFMALQMIAASWCETGSAVVANCFRHAGFAVQCAEICDSAIEAYDGDTDRDEDRLLDQDEEIAVAWADLQESDVPADVHISEFLQANSCLVVREEMTDGVSSDDDDTFAQCDPALPPTSQVLDAFDIIRRCIGSQDDDEAMALLAACESRVVPSLGKKRKQAKLSDFWH
ncbi:hypothetical protein HPB51_013094 [Rhipicephalus microplus]|uniref:Tick transposon n=1 Tax=Rhipicephalus microplus TaxID=6941 RepID=A0A9J6F315_RHIMP|nr:hypothetical protein HPB51_013094 [Rhipicephalus microplus]